MYWPEGDAELLEAGFFETSRPPSKYTDKEVFISRTALGYTATLPTPPSMMKDFLDWCDQPPTTEPLDA